MDNIIQKFYVGNNEYTYVSNTGDILKNDDMWDKNESSDFSEVETRRKMVISKEQWLNSEVLQSLWLSISHMCNMVCEYCYADAGQYGSIEALMDFETAKNSIDFFFKYLKKDSKKIKVNFFGGEPLLNKEVFLQCVDYINYKANEIKKDVRYIITTNGTLIDNDILNIFESNHFLVNLSLDGNIEAHNCSRYFKNGQGTFEVIWGKLNMLMSNNVEVIVRMTLTKKNIKFFRDSVIEIWNKGVELVYFAMVQSEDKCLQIENQDLIKFEKDLEELTKIENQRNKQGLKGTLGNIMEYEHRIANRVILKECRFYSSFTITFTPNGDIYTCNRVIGDDQYVAGNVIKGIDWNKLKRDYECPEICRKCWAKHICAGGCPISRTDLNCEFNKILINVAMKDYIELKERG